MFTAAGGNEALKLLENNEINLVLSDVNMPNGNGIELLEEIKRRNAFLPVVMFITQYGDISLEEAYNKGADAVFAKPFARKALFEVVTRVIQPPEVTLTRKVSRVEVEIPVGLKFAGGHQSAQMAIRNLGRGGFFVELSADFPEVAERVEFRLLSSSNPAVEIVGHGVVRWVRRTPDGGLPTGCGIEFEGLEPNCKKRVIELINFSQTKSFIPIK